MIRDIWAGPDPRGHRHEKRGARQKHHLHIIKQLGGSQRLPPAAAVLPRESRGRHQAAGMGTEERMAERGEPDWSWSHLYSTHCGNEGHLVCLPVAARSTGCTYP